MRNFVEFSDQGSGWSLKEIKYLDIKINKCSGISAGASFRDLPDEIKRKRCCVNIQSNDGACFAWAVTSALEPATNRNPQRVSSYRHYLEVLNLDGIEMPFSLNQLSKFEKQNNLSINIYSLKEKKRSDIFYIGKPVNIDIFDSEESNTDEDDNDEKEEEETSIKSKYEIVPIIVSNNIKDRHVNLLLIQKSNDNKSLSVDDSSYHYCWISVLRYNAYKGRQKKRKFVSHRCLSFFQTEEKLNCHINYCLDHKSVKMVMPTENQKYLYFKNFSHKERVPFAIYFDLETLLLPISNAMPSAVKSYTVPCQKHVPYNIGYFFHCSYDKRLWK